MNFSYLSTRSRKSWRVGPGNSAEHEQVHGRRASAGTTARDAKKRDDVKAAVLMAEQRKAFDLQEKVRSQWVRTKAGLLEEIGRANEVLERHNLPERFALP